MKQDETCPILRCAGPSSYNSNISNILWDYLDVVTLGILGHRPNLWPAPEFSPQGHQLGLLRWRPDVDKVRRLFGHEAGEVEEVGVHSRGFGLKQRSLSFHSGSHRSSKEGTFQQFPGASPMFSQTGKGMSMHVMCPLLLRCCPSIAVGSLCRFSFRTWCQSFGFFGFEDCRPDFRPMNGFALLLFEETQLLSSTVTGWNEICPWSDPTLAEPNRIRTP